MSDYYVYIMANRARALYAGFTNNLPKRVYEHKHMVCHGFTRRYLIDRLVNYRGLPMTSRQRFVARSRLNHGSGDRGSGGGKLP